MPSVTTTVAIVVIGLGLLGYAFLFRSLRREKRKVRDWNVQLQARQNRLSEREDAVSEREAIVKKEWKPRLKPHIHRIDVEVEADPSGKNTYHRVRDVVGAKVISKIPFEIKDGKVCFTLLVSKYNGSDAKG